MTETIRELRWKLFQVREQDRIRVKVRFSGEKPVTMTVREFRNLLFNIPESGTGQTQDRPHNIEWNYISFNPSRKAKLNPSKRTRARRRTTGSKSLLPVAIIAGLALLLSKR